MTAETSLKTVVSDYPRNLGVKVLAADEFSVQSLMKLGLTEYEARIYVVLTKMGPRNASEISFLVKVPRPKTYGAIRGLESKRLQNLISEAKVNVCFTTTTNGLVRVYKAQSEVLEKAAQRGAKVKVVAPVNQTNASVARELAEVIEVRNVTVPIMHFASADSAEIIFLEDIPDDTNVNAGQDVATWTNDPLLVKSHEKIFETIWSTLQPKEAMKAKAR